MQNQRKLFMNNQELSKRTTVNIQAVETHGLKELEAKETELINKILE